MKPLIILSFFIMLLFFATSCRTRVVASKPAPRVQRHHWYQRHPPAQKKVIIIK